MCWAGGSGEPRVGGDRGLAEGCRFIPEDGDAEVEEHLAALVERDGDSKQQGY